MKHLSLILTLIGAVVFQHTYAQVVDSMFGLPNTFFNLPNSFVYGTTACDFEGRADQCYGVIHLDDGRIILAGDSRTTDGTSDFAISRLLPNGHYDDSAGPDGEVRIDLGYAYDSCLAATKYLDNHLLMGGGVRLMGKYVNLIAKVDFDGILDPSFGDAGKIEIDLPSEHEMVTKFIPLPDGNIIIAGNALYGSSFYYPDSTAVFIGRLHPNGQIDSTYGINGFTYHRLEEACNTSILGDIAVDNTGRIVFTGGAYDPYPGIYAWNDWCKQNMVVHCLSSNGFPDTNFGTGGKVEIPGKYSRGTALHIYEDGRILLAGVAGDQLLGQPIYTFMTRILTNGDIDTSFGTDGKFQQFVSVFGFGVEPVGIIVQNNNILFAYIEDPNGDHASFGVFCLTENGQVNTQFGYNGRFDYVPNLVPYYINQITFSDNNHFFVSGYYRYLMPNNMMIVKVNMDDISTTSQPVVSNTLSISPNPTNGIFNINFSGPIPEKATVIIRDINQRIVYLSPTSSADNPVKIDASMLMNGIYSLELVAENSRSITKIVVQK